MGFVSCGGSDCDQMSAATDAQAYLELGTAYQNEASTENCEAYKKALEDFISDFEGCDDVTISGQVDVTKNVLATLEC